MIRRTLSASLTDAAVVLVSTLTVAGPDAQIWCPVGNGDTALVDFWLERVGFG